jgi:hypothetical protein
MASEATRSKALDPFLISAAICEHGVSQFVSRRGIVDSGTQVRSGPAGRGRANARESTIRRVTGDRRGIAVVMCEIRVRGSVKLPGESLLRILSGPAAEAGLGRIRQRRRVLVMRIVRQELGMRVRRVVRDRLCVDLCAEQEALSRRRMIRIIRVDVRPRGRQTKENSQGQDLMEPARDAELTHGATH